MTTTDSRIRLRRAGGFGVLLAAVVAVVALKASTAGPATQQVALPPAPQSQQTAVGQGGSTTSSSPSSAGSPPVPGSSTTSAPTNQVVQGSVSDTPYGPVQVELTITGGKIVDVRALQLPSSSGHSQRIAALAAPMLRTEVLTAQSARIDTVSGATYTSQGYAQSVQYALDHSQG
jgi:uncharacterized protein with FMN-binding domain